MCRRKVMEACWGAPSFFSLHPVGVYMGISTVSELITQSAYLVRRTGTCWYSKGSSRLYHS
eukprot:scaffold170437_cov44-Attheya_sp.AAC.1